MYYKFLDLVLKRNINNAEEKKIKNSNSPSRPPFHRSSNLRLREAKITIRLQLLHFGFLVFFIST